MKFYLQLEEKVIFKFLPVRCLVFYTSFLSFSFRSIAVEIDSRGGKVIDNGTSHLEKNTVRRRKILNIQYSLSLSLSPYCTPL